jgi:hypothetical protein
LVSDEVEVDLLNREGTAREDQLASDRVAMEVSRRSKAMADNPAPKPSAKPKK